jgi:alpha-1,3-rhamnosyltransferase
MQEENPLVSIIIITYNSSKYVLETLESSKGQTYQNIELIVSDDCSTDYTVEICRVWIEENKERFVRTEMITTEKNTGIPANCNRGLYAAKGKWIKFIAGDDALLENCILDNINYIIAMPENVYALHSNVKYYSSVFDENFFLFNTDRSFDTFCCHTIRAADQLKLLVRGYGPLAPSSFFNGNTLSVLGGFDEKLPYEDGPLWVKLTLNNYKIHYLHKTTVKYRLHDSISNNIEDRFLFKQIYKMDKVVFENVYKPHLKIYEIFGRKASFLIKDIFCLIKLNNKNKISSFLFKLLNSPFILLQKFSFLITDIKIQNNIKNGN